MDPQPARPDHTRCKFNPLTNPSTEWGEVKLSRLCEKCLPIRDWLCLHYVEMFPEKEKSSADWEPVQYEAFDHYASGELLHRSYLAGCHLCTFIKTAFGMTRSPQLTQALVGEDGPRYKRPKIRPGTLDNAHVFDEQHILAGLELDNAVSLRVVVHPFNANVLIYPGVHGRAGEHLTYERGIFGAMTVTAVAKDGSPREPYPLFLRSTKGEFVRGGGAPPDLYSPAKPDDSSTVTISSPISTNSADTIHLVRSWLRDCLLEHPNCLSKERLRLPTRLLRVENSGKQVRLVSINNETLLQHSERAQKCIYAVLSYCWGRQGGTFRLTEGTKSQLAAGIEVNLLPRTIQDAVAVTHSLGLSWLWVDALCIIQDSPRDWEEEAGRMQYVYEGAVVCIAALGASDSSQGLFSIRDPLKYSFLHLFESASHGWIDVCPPWMAQPFDDPWPLETRGWVLQERLLAQRTVRFGPYLAWECRHCLKDEFGFDRNTPHLSGPLFESIRLLGMKDEDYAHEKILAKWQAILSEYVHTRLTVATDRLPAITGVINKLISLTGWTNHFALWERFMPMELLWRVADGGCVPSTARVGPSWAWAGLGSLGSDWDLDLNDVKETVDCPGSTRTVLARVEFDSDSSPLPRGWGHTGTNPAIWVSYPPLQPRYHYSSGLTAAFNGVARSLLRAWSAAIGSDEYGDQGLDFFAAAEKPHPQDMPMGWPELAMDDFNMDHKLPEGDYTGVSIVPIISVREFRSSVRIFALAVVEVNGQAGVYRRIGTVSWIPRQPESLESYEDWFCNQADPGKDARQRWEAMEAAVDVDSKGLGYLEKAAEDWRFRRIKLV